MSRLQQAAHIAEIVGSVAVVVSLLYVGYELRQNTHAVQASNHQALLELSSDGVNAVVGDAELTAIYAKMRSGDEQALDPVQKERASLIRLNSFNIWEAAYYDYKAGQMEPELWHAWSSVNLGDWSDSQQQWWKANREQFGKSFQEYVDASTSQR